MKELLGLEVINVFISQCREFLVFSTYDFDNLNISDIKRIHVYFATGECCSQTWFESVNNVENIITKRNENNPIIGIEIKQRTVGGSTDAKQEYDCIKVYGYTFKTLKGYTDIEFRNGSNGYYDGSCRYLDNIKEFDVIDGKLFINFRENKIEFFEYTR